MVCVSPVKGLVAVPLHVVVRVMSRSSWGYGPSSMERQPWGGGVVVADQVRVGVQIHALGPDRSCGGGDQVRSSISPVPFVVRGGERDRNVASQQIDDVGLGGGGDCDNRGDELVRVGNTERSLIQPGPVSVDHGCCRIENVPRCRQLFGQR